MVSLLSIQTGRFPTTLVEAEYVYICSHYKRRCRFCSEAPSPLLGCLALLYFCSNCTLGMCSEGLVEVGSLSAFTEEKNFSYSCRSLKWWPASLSGCYRSSFQVCTWIWVETCQKEESSLVSPHQPGFCLLWVSLK